MNKDNVIDALKDMPEHFEMDAFIERLVLIRKIEEGLDDERLSKVVSEDELETEIDSW